MAKSGHIAYLFIQVKKYFINIRRFSGLPGMHKISFLTGRRSRRQINTCKNTTGQSKFSNPHTFRNTAKTTITVNTIQMARTPNKWRRIFTMTGEGCRIRSAAAPNTI